MANKVTIDVEARFVDHVSDGADAASQSVKEIGDSADKTQKILDKLTKKKPIFDADNSKLLKKLKEAEDKAAKLGKTKTTMVLKAVDKATNVIGKVLNKGQSFASKVFTAALRVKDSNAVSTLKNVIGMGKQLAGKTWTTLVKIKDMATAPLSKLKNSLFSIKTLVATITAGLAAKQFVVNPVSTADSIEQSKIAFESKLGSSAAADNFLQKIYKFDEKSPFDTLEIVGITQQMMNLGWTAENVLDDLGTIGDWSASLGKGEEGISAVTRALGQMRMKGKLSSEEMLQLTEAGVNAWQYVADYMGKDIAQVREMAEDGVISVDTAIKAIMTGMGEYTGAAATQADRTVTGLIDQIKSLFQTYVKLPWGEGLGEGFKDALVKIRDLIDENKDTLKEFGEMAKEIGSKISTWLADRVENALNRIKEITGTFEFKNASLGEKFKMLWKGVITDPLKEWWEGGGQEKTAETAGKIGSWMGETITKGLLAIFGATDVLKDGGAGERAGSSIAGSFLQGFLDNFDGSAITNAFVQAISNVWGALPWWAKLLVTGKIATSLNSGIGSLVSTAGNLKTIIGNPGNYMMGGTGVSSMLAGLGYKLTGGAAAGSAISGGAAAGAGLGALTTGAGLIHAFSTGRQAYRDFKAGDKTAGKANAIRSGATFAGIGGGALIGAKAGAAIGSIGGPAGTLIGAGLGTVVGWFAGDKIARNIEAAKYESEEMKEAIKDADKSAEELAQTFEKAKWENATKHFGDIKLSLSEIERLADQIVWGDDKGSFEKFSTAAEQAKSSLESFKSASATTEKWMWKAGLGVKFNDDEVEEIKASFDEYINSAKSYLENKHYEFTASAELILDLESKEGKAILESGNAFYAAEQEKLDKAGKELGDALSKALKDGIINADEEEAILAAQEKIAEITAKISNAEQEAEIELIKVKFGNGNLDLESFETFMSTMETTLNERMSSADEALKVQIKNLKLRYPKGGEEYEKELKTIIEGYEAKVESIKADVLGVELNIIGDAYKDELGDDAAKDLQKALEYAINEGIDPVEISDKKLAELLNVEELGPETAANIKDMLSGVFSQLELIEVDGNVLLKIGEVSVEDFSKRTAEEKIKDEIPDSVREEIKVALTGEKQIENNIEILKEDFGIPESKAEQLLIKLTGAKSIENQIDIIAKEFGINESEAANVLWKLYGEKSILNTIGLTADDFGIPDEVKKTVKVKVTGAVTSTGNIKMDYAAKQAQLYNQGYRGGVFGGESALQAFARGGEPDFPNGGIVGGSTRFIRVNEESPEMIIPLSSQRRERALKLWAKTGELLDAPGFARGGMSRGDQDEGLRFHNYDSNDSVDHGKTVQVEVGGITVQINVEANDNANIVEAIREQSGEIAEEVAGILVEAFSSQFENTPVRGGVA